MTSVSRREFFKWIPAEIADQIAVPDALKTLLKSSPPGAAWHPVGRLAELVPGTRRRVSVGDNAILLASIGEGIRATLSDGTAIALRAAPGGSVEANPTIEWPQNCVLSHLSNEPVELDGAEPLNEPGDIHE